MNKTTEKWLKQGASKIHKEICDNTVTGKIGLDEFADYVGVNNGEAVLYSIMKNVAIHVSHMSNSNEQ